MPSIKEIVAEFTIISRSCQYCARIDRDIEERYNLSMTPGLIAAVCTSLFMVGAKSYRTDEALSLVISGSPQLLHTLWFQEFNMWLYYGILRYWRVWAVNEGDIRLLSAFCAIGAIPFIYKIGERLFNKRIATMTSIFTAVNVFFVLYAQYARGYALVLFLSSASMYFFIRLMNNEKAYLPGYVIVSALSVYAHLFAALIILSQFISVLLLRKKPVKSMVFSAAGIAVMLLPLVLAPSAHSQQTDWISQAHLASIIGTYVILFGDFIPLFLFESIVILLFFPWRKTREWKYGLLFVWMTVPVLTAFLINLSGKHVYQSVYFISLLPACMMLVSVAADHIRKERIYGAVVGGVLVLSAVRLVFWYTGDTRFVSSINNRNTDWRGAAQYVVAHAGPRDGVIFFPYFIHHPFLMYQKSLTPFPIELASVPYSTATAPLLPQPDIERIEAFSYPRVWFVHNNVIQEQFHRREQYDAIESALRKRYRTIRVHMFYEVRIEELVLSDD